MKVLMLFPPTGVLSAGLGAPLLGNAFLDMQANVVELSMKRSIVEHDIPGREGGIIQDIGSKSKRLNIKGKWIHENHPDNEETVASLIGFLGLFATLGKGLAWNWIRIKTLEVAYHLKLPVIMACDLTVSLFMIESVTYSQTGGQPNVYDYDINLIELNPFFGAAGLSTGTILTQFFFGADTEVGR